MDIYNILGIIAVLVIGLIVYMLCKISWKIDDLYDLYCAVFDEKEEQEHDRNASDPQRG